MLIGGFLIHARHNNRDRDSDSGENVHPVFVIRFRDGERQAGNVELMACH